MTKNSEEAFSAGTTLTGTLPLDSAVPEENVDAWQVRFYDRSDSSNTVYYTWQFFPADDNDSSEDSSGNDTDSTDDSAAGITASGGSSSGCNTGLPFLSLLLGSSVLFLKRR